MSGLLYLALDSAETGQLVYAEANATTINPIEYVAPVEVQHVQTKTPTILEKIQKDLGKLILDCPGSPGFVVTLENAPQSIQFNGDSVIQAASVIKLPIMFALYGMQSNGELDLSDELTITSRDRTHGSGILKKRRPGFKITLQELVELMMQKSDNTATNAIIRHVGIKKLNKEFRSWGLKHTRLIHPILKSKGDNPTTPREIATLLTYLSGNKKGLTLLPTTAPAIPRSDLLEMRIIMSGSKNKKRLGRNIPRSTELANKTGTLGEFLHDVGIIRTSIGDITIAAFTWKVKDRRSAEKWIGMLGKIVYNAVEEAELKS